MFAFTRSWSESVRFLAVDHPRYAKLVHEHAKAWRPERRPERHEHVPIFRQGLTDAFALRQVLKADVHVEALWFVIALRWGVHTHQYLIAPRLCEYARFCCATRQAPAPRQAYPREEPWRRFCRQDIFRRT